MKTQHSKFISCLLCGFLFQFCGPIISPWPDITGLENNAIQEKNVHIILSLATDGSLRRICFNFLVNSDYYFGNYTKHNSITSIMWSMRLLSLNQIIKDPWECVLITSIWLAVTYPWSLEQDHTTFKKGSLNIYYFLFVNWRYNFFVYCFVQMLGLILVS